MKKLFYVLVGMLVIVGLSYSQSIQITSPNGGEFLQSQSLNIVWTTSGITGDVKINLRKADGSTGITLFNAVAYNSSPQSYRLTSVEPGTYFIKIKQGTVFDKSANFIVKRAPIDWGAIRDKLRRFREIDWEAVIVGPHGPGPVCLSCPPDFKWRHYIDLLKELGVKEKVTLEIVRGNEVLGRKVFGGGIRLRGMNKMRTLKTLRVAKISEASGKAIREKGASVKLIVRNAQGKIVMEQAVKLNQRAARR